jgi:hypothetical protein
VDGEAIPVGGERWEGRWKALNTDFDDVRIDIGQNTARLNIGLGRNGARNRV